MLGIRIKTTKYIHNTINKFLGGKITNDYQIRSLMEAFKVDESGHCASIKEADLGYGWIHYSIVRTIKPKNILCIGSRHGYIPAVLAQACKDNGYGHVDFVDAGYGGGDRDHWTGVGFWKAKAGKEVFKNFSLGKFISLHVKDTKEFAKSNKNRYEYIYVDGNHSYKGVCFDYKKFWGSLNKNGFMIFHDINVSGQKPEGCYGVKKFWRQVANKRFIEFPFSESGLGIIQKS